MLDRRRSVLDQQWRNNIRRVQREQRGRIDTNHENNNSSSSRKSKSYLRKLQKRHRLTGIHPPQRITRRSQIGLNVDIMTTKDRKQRDLANSSSGGPVSSLRSRKVTVAAEEQENDSLFGNALTLDPMETQTTRPATMPHLEAATEDSSPTSSSPDEDEASSEEDDTSMAGRLIRRSVRLVTPMFKSSNSSLRPPPTKRRLVGRNTVGDYVVSPQRRSTRRMVERHDHDVISEDDSLHHVELATTQQRNPRSETPPVPERPLPVTRRGLHRSGLTVLKTTPRVGISDVEELEEEEFEPEKEEEGEENYVASTTDDDDDSSGAAVEDSSSQTRYSTRDRGVKCVQGKNISGRIMARRRVIARYRYTESHAEEEGNETNRSIDRHSPRSRANQHKSPSDISSAKGIEVVSRVTRSRTRDLPATSADETDEAELSTNQVIPHHDRLQGNPHKTFDEKSDTSSTEERDVDPRTFSVSSSPTNAVASDNGPLNHKTDSRREARPDSLYAQNSQRRSIRLCLQTSLVLPSSSGDQESQASSLQSIPSRPIHEDEPAGDKTRADSQVAGPSTKDEEPVVRRCCSPPRTAERSFRGKRTEEPTGASGQHDVPLERIRKAPSRLEDFVCQRSKTRTRKRDRDQFEAPVALSAYRSLASEDTASRQSLCRSPVSSSPLAEADKPADSSETASTCRRPTKTSQLKIDVNRDEINDSKDVPRKKRGRPRKVEIPSVGTAVVHSKCAETATASTRRHSPRENRDGIKEVSVKKKRGRPRLVKAVVEGKRFVTAVTAARHQSPKKNRDGIKQSEEVSVKKRGRPRKHVAAEQTVRSQCVGFPLSGTTVGKSYRSRCVVSQPLLQRYPLLDYTPLTDEYEAMVAKNVVKSIRFGPSFESACVAVERGIRHYESRTSDVVDPDVLADEKLYRKSLRSHQSFEAQEKLNLLDEDDDDESISDDSELDDKQTMTLLEAMADAPIVWSDQVRIRSRGSQCKPDCRFCRVAARELCCVLVGTTTFTPGITAIGNDADFELDDAIHANTLNALKRLRHSLAFLERA
jgi:AT hook motif